MVMLNALQSIFSIVLMISIGYILTAKNWFDDSSSKLLSKLVTTVSLPALMLSNLMTSFTKEKLLSSGKALLIPFISMIVIYLLGIFVSKFIKVKPERRGVFMCMFFASNTIFIGLPVNLALFGNVSLPYVLLYYIANTTLFWTIGVYGISKDSTNGKVKIFSFDTVKRIFSPPLIGFIISVILIMLNITLPKFIMDTSSYMGNLTTPLSMLFIGITIRSISLRSIRFDKDMAAVLIGRFVLSPVLVIVLCHFIPVPALMEKVFVVQAAMPVMTQTAIISKAYDADYEYSTVLVTVTTIASLIVIPLYMGLLSIL